MEPKSKPSNRTWEVYVHIAVETNTKFKEEIERVAKASNVALERMEKSLSDALFPVASFIVPPGFVYALTQRQMEHYVEEKHRVMWGAHATPDEWPPSAGQVVDRFQGMGGVKEDQAAPRSAAEFLERKRQRVIGKRMQQSRVKPWESPAKQFR